MKKASDEDILALAGREYRVIITIDKDFGKLIFKLGKPSTGVILIRTSITDPEKRFEMIRDALEKANGKFVVVSEGQIRVRELK